MALENLIKNYADYTLAMNKKTIAWLKEQPSEVIDFEVTSSFSSIRKTLWHLRNTERFWLSILNEEIALFQSEIPEDNNVLFEMCLTQNELFVQHILSLSESELEEMCEIDMPWMKATMPRYEYIQHCINHSSYHRGQIITIARNAGVEKVPMTDYAAYLVRESGKY